MKGRVSMYNISGMINDVSVFLDNNGWQRQLCDVCGRDYFFKSFNKKVHSTCKWRDCNKSNDEFKSLPKQKKLLTSTQVKDKIKNFFILSGFKQKKPRNISNTSGQTDLIIAGVQIFDDIIHGDNPIQKEKIFISQPCVRMKFQPLVKSNEGTSTSFVNICTEEMDASAENHLQSIDYWLTVLSKLGLHMKDVSIIARTSVKNWGTGNFTAFELFFSYSGLELGDASYLQIPKKGRNLISISDIGFGLERITWAINKTSSYFNTLKPWSICGDREIFDLCRTLALFSICGVRASNKGAGLQLRRLAKILSTKHYRDDINLILDYYFDYWLNFIEPCFDKAKAIKLTRLEIDRFLNLKLYKLAKFPAPRKETTEAYLHRLAYDLNIDTNVILNAINLCKK